MSTLFKKLPSFATDYSGFLSVMHGLGGMMVVYDPSGCLGNYTNCDEPRWYSDPGPVYTANLRELEAVCGDQETLIEKVVNTAGMLHPEFICILMTPVPSLVGFDIDTAAQSMSDRCDIPCFGIHTDGFCFYNDGISRALDLIYTCLSDNSPVSVPGSVNVLGMTPLDYHIFGEEKKMASLISGEGWKVNCFLGMGNDYRAVKRLRAAEKNIVMSAAALPLAKRMLADDGIPFWVGPPYGESGVLELKAFLHNSESDQPCSCTTGPKILVIGEQACANAIRRAYSYRYPASDITVASFFGIDPDIAMPGDKELTDEKDLKIFLSENPYETVVGDPLFAPFCPEQTRFVEMPHPAVSSKLHWNHYMSLIG